MTQTHGFTLVSSREITELNTTAHLYRHDKTGAEFLSMINSDENKVFGITFRTPPTDSTGLPHIMEHAVLCGSRKYPLKEPFVELLKGSLKTFLNAMTFSDKTCYPVASTNMKDYYNLVDVYLDAVFHPRITPEIFQQEGWHYELNTLDEPLSFKGVVYNEMKGAYSSPDSLMYRYSEQVLFPDNIYNFDSGGDPQTIPDLTYEQFRHFHETYYHPSNARIFMYGDDDPTERLRLLNAYLADYEAIDVASEIDLQPSLSTPRTVTRTYPGSDDQQKAMLTMNWLLPENNDPALTFALQMLSHVLMRTQASPLRKALIDSGLGEDVIGGGLSDSLRQLYFSTGLKGVDPARLTEVEEVILNTLRQLVAEGIDPATTEAALNTVEFMLREQNFGSYPRGLVLMIWSLSTWLHNGDPLAPLAYEAPLARLKQQLQDDDRFFERLIETHLLQNPHRVTLHFKADPGLQQQLEAREKERLAAVEQTLSEADRQAIIDKTLQLKKMQETPDPPEALATIPSLTLDDLDKEVKLVPLSELQHQEATILHHDLFTNGIVYTEISFDMHRVPQDLLPYVSLFTTALTDVGTETEDYVKLTQRIGRKTGGVSASNLVMSRRHSPEAVTRLMLHGKSTVDQAPDMLEIMRDMVLTVKLDNPERFKQIVLEEKAGLEAGLIPAGHRVVNGRLQAQFTEASWVTDQISGISYLFFLRRLAETMEQDWPSVLEKLERVRQLLINRQSMLVNITLDENNWQTVQPAMHAFINAVPSVEAQHQPWQPGFQRQPEGLTIPAQVNYVAKGANLYELGYELHGSVSVITNYLRTSWLWEKIRVQGGAYGAFCSFNQQSGMFSYASYRDPNLLGTLTNYDNTVEFLNQLDLTREELTKGIIGAISNLDSYQLPDAKGYSSMVRWLIGYSDAERQQYRDQVLSTSAADFKTFADALDQVRRQGLVAVLGSAEAIEAANAELDPKLTVTKVL